MERLLFSFFCSLFSIFLVLLPLLFVFFFLLVFFPVIFSSFLASFHHTLTRHQEIKKLERQCSCSHSYVEVNCPNLLLRLSQWVVRVVKKDQKVNTHVANDSFCETNATDRESGAMNGVRRSRSLGKEGT